MIRPGLVAAASVVEVLSRRVSNSGEQYIIDVG